MKVKHYAVLFLFSVMVMGQGCLSRGVSEVAQAQDQEKEKVKVKELEPETCGVLVERYMKAALTSASGRADNGSFGLKLGNVVGEFKDQFGHLYRNYLAATDFLGGSADHLVVVRIDNDRCSAVKGYATLTAE